tara:strand:+ start:669 stop:821 length:153 start_codon:yes stop_codon:yes gene_type:complete
MEETLEYWEDIRDQRQEDISLEQARDEDQYLIQTLKQQLDVALAKIQELE